MKKIIYFLFIFMLFIGTKTYAQNFNVIIENKNVKVNEVKVEVDDKELYTDFSAYTATGRTFVPIRELTESLGAKVDWDNKTRSATVTLNEKVVKLKIDSKIVYINGKKTNIDKESMPRFATYLLPRKETKTMVPLRFLSETFGYDVEWNKDDYIASVKTAKNNGIEAVDNEEEKSKDVISKENNNEKGFGFDFSSEVNNNTATVDRDDNTGEISNVKRNISQKLKVEGPVTIVIDPGHGGKDSGALGQGNIKEKDLTLEIGKKLYNKLKENNMDAYLTRDEDYFVTLDGRADYANKLNAELYLSIHMNASDNTTANGIEVFYAPALRTPIKDTEQIYFAKALQKSLINATDATDRGVKNGARLVVLRKTKGVSALAELGFITNRNEADLLQDEEYQDKLVEALFNGIKDYIDNYVE